MIILEVFIEDFDDYFKIIAYPKRSSSNICVMLTLQR